MSRHVVILGGGLAGLASAYEMSKRGIRVTVVEREPHVGGMATSFEEGDRRTAGQEGSNYWSYDFGPHRFHTHETELLRHVEEILGENKFWRKRLSRIYLFGRLFNYPLELHNVLRNIPPLQAAGILLDYVRIRVLDGLGFCDYRDRSFREWVEKRFGPRLAEIFFIQYTEKAWGISADQISSVWAAQRITLLSLWDTIIKTVFRPKEAPRTLVSDFVYPRVGGIGELGRGYRHRIEEMGGAVLTNAPAIRVHRQGPAVQRIEYRREGQSHFIEGDEFLSTMPVTALARSVTPKAPPEVRRALRELRYISCVFVYLKLDKDQMSPDHWIYLPEKELHVHRVSEPKNFSPYAAPPGKTVACAEITCRAGDAIWRAPHEQLRDMAIRDLTKVGLIRPEEVLDSFVKRIPFAYPLYDLTYQEHLEVVMDFVRGLENLETGGRQGLYRYNNMDQSIEMGRRMAARVLGDGQADHESVATEQRYFG